MATLGYLEGCIRSSQGRIVESACTRAQHPISLHEEDELANFAEASRGDFCARLRKGVGENALWLEPAYPAGTQ
jgi:hypothetical protein